jgi:hypothetical protein
MRVILGSSPEGQEIQRQTNEAYLRSFDEWRSPEGRTTEEEIDYLYELVDELEEAHPGEFDDYIDGLLMGADKLRPWSP